MQAKLLRVLQEKEIERVGDQRPIKVNVRLMSATNRTMDELLRAGKFREDLFYRINVIPVHVPPLRERIDDIPHLISHYLERINQINKTALHRVSPQALNIIEAYPWPGNVRQLINMIEYAAMTARGDTIEAMDLPEYLFRKQSSADVICHAGKPLITEAIVSAALKQFHNNKTATARYLGISRVTLWKHLKRMTSA
jgi:transcriptional regulator with PAS, ATPase and Fis domain